MINTKRIEDMEWLSILPTDVFWGSFTIGTALILLYAIFQIDTIAMIGLFYVMFAIPVNLLVLLILIIYSFVYRQHQLTILLKAVTLLINIPIAILYFYIAMGIIDNH